MANQYVNKVIINGETKIDLSSDTVAANKLLSGFTAHDKSGTPIEGSCTFDADTSDGTVTADEMLSGAIGYKNGQKVTGTMPNNGGVEGEIDEKTEQYTIPAGYHDGSGKVGISSVEQSKIIPSNIKAGISILGIEGEYSGEGATAQAKTATPSFTRQTIIPDTGYDYLSQVVVEVIPVTYTDNAAGGQTCTIG